ncbi:MAG: hypothetical protein ACR2GR_06595 [Rhodothermales bacterium]
MDEKLHILRHLYAEEQDAEHDGAWLRQQVRKDEALRQEYEALAEVKRHLDRRPPQRPDVQVIDQVVAAAAQQPALRLDRGAAPPARRRFPAFVATTFTLLVLVSIGLWQFLPATSETEALSAQGETATTDSFASEEVAEAEAAPAPEAQIAQSKTRTPQSEDRLSAPEAASPAADRLAEASSQPAESLVASSVPALEPASRSAAMASAAQNLADVQPVQPAPLVATTADIGWDDTDDVQRLYRQIELVQARSNGLEWENPMVQVSAPLLSDPMMTDPRFSEPLLHRPPLEPTLFQTSPPSTLGRGQ